MKIFYFGCWKEPGHYFFTPGMVKVHGEVSPWGYNIDSRDFSDSGWWLRKTRDGWTAIGRRDNSVDSRPGSHSTFVFDHHLVLDEAIKIAKESFPEIFERTGWN